MTAASGSAVTSMTLRSTVTRVCALLKRRCCSVVGSPVSRSVNDHEKTENIDKKDTITKKQTNKKKPQPNKKK